MNEENCACRQPVRKGRSLSGQRAACSTQQNQRQKYLDNHAHRGPAPRIVFKCATSAASPQSTTAASSLRAFTFLVLLPQKRREHPRPSECSGSPSRDPLRLRRRRFRKASARLERRTAQVHRRSYPFFSIALSSATTFIVYLKRFISPCWRRTNHLLLAGVRVLYEQVLLGQSKHPRYRRWGGQSARTMPNSVRSASFSQGPESTQQPIASRGVLVVTQRFRFQPRSFRWYLKRIPHQHLTRRRCR